MRRLSLQRVLGDQRGVAAMQFAFIAPMIFFIYIGVVSSFTATRAVQQATSAATTLSDLASRMTQVDDTSRDSLYATADALLSRWGGNSSYEITITVVENPTEASAKEADITEAVLWSEATNALYVVEDDDLASYALPDIAEGESMVVVTVSGTYKPVLAGWGLPSTITTQRSSVRRPRFATVLQYVD